MVIIMNEFQFQSLTFFCALTKSLFRLNTQGNFIEGLKKKNKGINVRMCISNGSQHLSCILINTDSVGTEAAQQLEVSLIFNQREIISGVCLLIIQWILQAVSICIRRLLFSSIIISPSHFAEISRQHACFNWYSSYYGGAWSRNGSYRSVGFMDHGHPWTFSLNRSRCGS